MWHGVAGRCYFIFRSNKHKIVKCMSLWGCLMKITWEPLLEVSGQYKPCHARQTFQQCTFSNQLVVANYNAWRENRQYYKCYISWKCLDSYSLAIPSVHSQTHTHTHIHTFFILRWPASSGCIQTGSLKYVSYYHLISFFLQPLRWPYIHSASVQCRHTITRYAVQRWRCPLPQCCCCKHFIFKQ